MKFCILIDANCKLEHPYVFIFCTTWNILHWHMLIDTYVFICIRVLYQVRRKWWLITKVFRNWICFTTYPNSKTLIISLWLVFINLWSRLQQVLISLMILCASLIHSMNNCTLYIFRKLSLREWIGKDGCFGFWGYATLVHRSKIICRTFFSLTTC